MIGEELGKYRVLAPIGKGGMASVFVGEHTLLGHKVAIKVLQKRHLDNKAIERRFFNEAKVIASIRHPNIVEIFDFGRGENNAAYIVMELLEGQTLRSRIRRGIMPERQSTIFMRQLASALAEAHAKGIIHRDLKPDNVFIIEDEEVELGERIKLLDFGIAKRIDPDTMLGPASEQTATGILVGTPAYMSPEQCKGLGNIDGRSDVYSLGVVLYRMLTNQLPFEAGGTGELIGKHLYVEPPSPREINPEISVGLEEVVMRCLAKEPENRFQNMGDLSNAFGELLSGDSTRHILATAPPAAADLGHPTPSGEHLARHLSPVPMAAPPIDEISATTLRTATGEKVSPAYIPDEDVRSRNWPLWAAVGCIAAMLLGVIALSSGGDSSAAETVNAAEGATEAAGESATKPAASVGTAVTKVANPAPPAATDDADKKAAAAKAKEAADEEAARKKKLADEKEAARKQKLADARAAQEAKAAAKAAAHSKRKDAKRLAAKRAEAARVAREQAAAKRAEEERQARAEAARREKARKDKEKKDKEKNRTFDDVKPKALY